MNDQPGSARLAPRGVGRAPTRVVPGGSAAGFSLIELVVAILILTVGLLGMAGGTAYVIKRTTLSEAETHRAAAVQAGLEEVRSLPFEEVSDGSKTIAPFTIRWEADPPGDTDARTKVITLVVEGPGRIPGTGPMPTLSSAVADTVTYRLIRRDPR
jgi:prepilin-type N-terminal cleavage/methylation domain-containing protein